MSVSDYERALGLQARYDGQAIDVVEPPSWLPSGKFWYRKTVRGGHAFVLVDPTATAKQPAFDHTRLAAGLSAAAAKSYTAIKLPFSTFSYVDGDRAISFTGDESIGWTCTLSDYTCTRGAAVADGAGAGRQGGRGAGGAGGGAPGGRGGGRGQGGVAGASRDGRLVAFIRDGNIYVRAD